MLSAWLPALHVLGFVEDPVQLRQLWPVEAGECWFQVLGHQPEVGSLTLSLLQPHLSAGSAALLFLIHI